MSSNTHAEAKPGQGAPTTDHVMSVKALIGTWGALMVLTAITVGATWVDLGPSVNFALAMVVATIKAIIVAALFMHLLHDQKYNLLVLITGMAALVLFVSISLMDVNEYKDDRLRREADAPFKVPGMSQPAP